MFRRKLIIAVAIATFVAGAGFHLQIMRLAKQVIRYDTIILEEPKTQTLVETDVIGLPFLDWCRVVVNMGTDRDLYIRKEFIGRTDDPQRLEGGIAREFARCDQELVDMQSHDLDAPIETTRWRPRMLYLKILVSNSEDVPRLVELSRAAGANSIEVFFDRKKSGAKLQ